MHRDDSEAEPVQCTPAMVKQSGAVHGADGEAGKRGGRGRRLTRSGAVAQRVGALVEETGSDRQDEKENMVKKWGVRWQGAVGMKVPTQLYWRWERA